MTTTLPLEPTGKARKVFGEISLPGIPPFPFAVVEGAPIKARHYHPRLLITAGIHGAEVAAIEAVRRVYSMLRPDQIFGTVVILPILNMGGFQARVPFVMPADGKNLNRQFPGNPDGTASERLAHWLMTKVYPHFDLLIDCHSGDLFENLRPFPIFVIGNQGSKDIAIATGLPYAVGSSTPGIAIAGADAIGLSGIILEVGGCGRWNEIQVDFINGALANIMNKLGMLVAPEFVEGLEKEDVTTAWNNLGMLVAPADDAPPPIIAKANVGKASCDGFWYPAKKPNDEVMVGDSMGTIRDIHGNVLANVKAVTAGIHLYGLVGLRVNKGDVLFYLATPIEE